VTQQPNDPPWAAAPPDGELSLHERMAIQIERGQPDGAEFLDGLSDEDLGEVAMAAAIEAELTEQDAAAEVPGVLPLRRPARPARVLNPRWAALAAVLAGVALIPFAWRGTQGGAVRVPSHAVAMLENRSAGLPEGWVENPVWDRTRGAGDAVTDTRTAVRFGAYMVDLQLAVRAVDADETRLVVSKMDILTQNVQAGGLLSATLREVAAGAGGDPSALLSRLEEVDASAADLLGGEWVALGAWTEAARLAARGRDAAFFREARTRRTLARAEELVGDNDRARAAIRAIHAALEPDSLQWVELETATADLLKAIG
jgi:hypothetical protein